MMTFLSVCILAMRVSRVGWLSPQSGSLDAASTCLVACSVPVVRLRACVDYTNFKEFPHFANVMRRLEQRNQLYCSSGKESIHSQNAEKKESTLI
jgi:hypothetical protein